jgi:hypothetical protein
MSDILTTETVAPPAQTPAGQGSTVESSTMPAAEQGDEFDKERAMKTIHNLREQEKEWKKQQKELEQYRAEKASRENAELSEAERLKKENAELIAYRDRLQADVWRRDVATEAGIPPALASRIQGATRDEMLADAQKLAEVLPQSTTTKTPPKVPPTNPGGATTNETEAQMRERLFGKKTNVFDLNNIQANGGGVVWNQQE